MWNRLKRPLQAVLLLALVALCAWAAFPVQQKIHLGLDLQGGGSFLLQLQTTPDVPKITNDVQNQVELVVQNRINALGVSEPVITKVGSDRLLVQLPALNSQEIDNAETLLKQTAKLDFKIIPDNVSKHIAADPKYAASLGPYNDSGPVVYSGAELKSAAPGFGPGGQPEVDFRTKDPTKFAKITRDNMGKPLGIFLDK